MIHVYLKVCLKSGVLDWGKDCNLGLHICMLYRSKSSARQS